MPFWTAGSSLQTEASARQSPCAARSAVVAELETASATSGGAVGLFGDGTASPNGKGVVGKGSTGGYFESGTQFGPGIVAVALQAGNGIYAESA